MEHEYYLDLHHKYGTDWSYIKIPYYNYQTVKDNITSYVTKVETIEVSSRYTDCAKFKEKSSFFVLYEKHHVMEDKYIIVPSYIVINLYDMCKDCTIDGKYHVLDNELKFKFKTDINEYEIVFSIKEQTQFISFDMVEKNYDKNFLYKRGVSSIIIETDNVRFGKDSIVYAVKRRNRLDINTKKEV